MQQHDVTDLRSTIVPKSDQLNSEQLLGGSMTVTVTEVRVSASDEQPVVVHYEGENGRPFKPCKTMRKLMVFAWGEDGRQWAGQSMTLYNDPSVKFGGMDVGGIRISHMTGIEKDIEVSLTATKGKKTLHRIRRLESGPSLADVLEAITAAADKAGMAKAKALAQQLTAKRDIDQALAAYGAKVDALKAKAAPKPVPFADQIAAATDMQTLQQIGEALTEQVPDGDEKEALTQQLLARETELSK